MKLEVNWRNFSAETQLDIRVFALKIQQRVTDQGYSDPSLRNEAQ
jgi:hypothetical protein